MTLVPWRMASWNDNQVYFEVTFNSKQWGPDPNNEELEVALDPTADEKVYSIAYQNLSNRPYQLAMSNRVYIAAPNTPRTVINIPTGQRFYIWEAPVIIVGPA